MDKEKAIAFMQGIKKNAEIMPADVYVNDNATGGAKLLYSNDDYIKQVDEIIEFLKL